MSIIKNRSIFLNHILESVNNIKDFTKEVSKTKFLKDKLIQSAVVRQFEIIGEAVKNLPIEFTVTYSNVEWSRIAGLRDKLIHHYFGVDMEKIWEVVKKEIPTLEKEIKLILKELK